MRRARANDYWRHVYERQYPSRLNRLDYIQIVGLGSGTISFSGGITAICGANGAGKSTLLKAIQHIFTDLPVLDSPGGRIHFSAAELTALLLHNGVESTRVVTFQAGNLPILAGTTQIPVTLINPASDSTGMVEYLADTQSIEELLEGLAPKILNPVELSLRSSIVGRDYDQALIYEIDDIDSGIPYFRVRSGPNTYGSETMGLGELAAYLTLWHLEGVPRNSIVLIEEPETFLSPRSQIALMNAIASISVSKSLWVIVTTHSPAVVTSIPLDHIRLISREHGVATVIGNPSQMQLETVLGIFPSYRGMALVEDKVASLWLRSLLEQLAPDLLRGFDITPAGSAEKVTAILANFPSTGTWLKLVGIYDAGFINPVQRPNRPYLFLPRTQPPEAELRAVSQGHANELAVLLGRNPHDVTVTLEGLEGTDHHVWLDELARNLGIPLEQAISILTIRWLAIDENKAAADTLVAQLRNILYGLAVQDPNL